MNKNVGFLIIWGILLSGLVIESSSGTEGTLSSRNSNDEVESGPTLSNLEVWIDDDFDVIFEATYSNPEGVSAAVFLEVDGVRKQMEWFKGVGPTDGMTFETDMPLLDLNEKSEFFIMAEIEDGDEIWLGDSDEEPFFITDYLDLQAEKDAFLKTDSGSGTRWKDPEVIIGIIALIGMGIGSAFTFWNRKRKQNIFSRYLTRLDALHQEMGTNSQSVNTDLEKIKTEIDIDLKNGAIDDGSYSILKDRIREINKELRTEKVRSNVQNLPETIEIQVKDMLIDGKITKKEYNQFMKSMKRTKMDPEDKKNLQAMVEEWMERDDVDG